MRNRILFSAAVAAALASASVQAQSISDAVWRSSIYGNYNHGTYGPTRGAFNTLDKETMDFGPSPFEAMRSGNYVVKFNDRVGFGVTRSISGRTAAFNLYLDNGSAIQAGAFRNSITGGRTYGLFFEQPIDKLLQ